MRLTLALTFCVISDFDGVIDSDQTNSDRNNIHRDRHNPMNVPYLKLQQRLVVLEEQAQQREHDLADRGTPQNQPQPQLVIPVVHMDSGLRLNGEIFEVNDEMVEVPPGYTAD